MKNLITSIILVLLVSCNNDSKTNVTDEKAFDYKAYLLRNNEDVFSLEVSDFNSDLIIQKLKDSLNTQCVYGLKFNSITKYGLINSMANNYCENTPICNRGFGVSLIINRYNEILFNEEVISIETLKTLDFAECLNRFGKKDSYLSIYQDRYADSKTVDTAIQSIISSYFRYIEELSQDHFYQPVQNLNPRELDSLKQITSFHLFFEDEILPPPPLVPNLKGEL